MTKQEQTDFIIAIEGGDCLVVKAMIKEGMDVTFEDGKPLRTACADAPIESAVALVEMLLEAGADPTAKKNIAVCWSPNLEITKLLIDAGGDVNTPDRGSPPLKEALRTRNDKWARALLEMGAKVDARIASAIYTSAHMLYFCEAGEQRDRDLIEELLDQLREVSLLDYKNVIQALFEDSAWEGHGGCSGYLVRLHQKGASIDYKNGQALLMAASGGHASTVSTLLGLGANPRQRESKAFRSAVKNGHGYVAEILYKNGADIAAVNDWALKSTIQRENWDMLFKLAEMYEEEHRSKDFRTTFYRAWNYKDRS